MPEGRRLCGVEVVWLMRWQSGWATIDLRQQWCELKRKPHLTKWTLVMAIKMRRLDTQAEAKPRDKAVERSE